jgi:flavin reductase (DIM6/NTAB) family NADH-FMN oxidoreductase RutF
MFYEPHKKNHGLPHDPFTALVVPRPIGWISTLDRDGRLNLAPYSFFNAISGKPPFVLFSSNNPNYPKHSASNAEATGEFVVNLATYELREEVNLTSAMVAADVNEAELAGLEMVPCVTVKAPRVKRSPVALECVVADIVRLKSRDGTAHPTIITIGEVVGVHIDDSVIVEGRIDFLKMKPLSRLGYMDYGVTDTVFTMARPK